MRSQGTKQWIEDYLFIINKQGDRVPFKLNPIQHKFLTEDVSGKDIVLKARQQGFSSLILAMFAKDFLTKENTYNVVVADDTDNAQGLLKRVKGFVQNWCEKEGFSEKQILKYNSKYELYFEAINSTYHIGTAQNTQFGRSRTITNLHLSEGAFYPHLMDILAGAGQAFSGQGKLIIETTANGYNEFQDFWTRSKLGETGFQAHFYPASDFYDIETLELKKQELKLAQDGGTYEQEYPDTDAEAFLLSGRPYFGREATEYYTSMIVKPIQDYV